MIGWSFLSPFFVVESDVHGMLSITPGIVTGDIHHITALAAQNVEAYPHPCSQEFRAACICDEWPWMQFDTAPACMYASARGRGLDYIVRQSRAEDAGAVAVQTGGVKLNIKFTCAAW